MPAPDYRTEIESHHILKFESDFKHVYQEMGPKLEKHVTVVPETGEGAVAVHLFGKATTRRDATPFRTNPVSNTPRIRVWYAANDPIEWGEQIETEDLWKQAQNPESRLMKAGAMQIARDVDSDIVSGMLGNRLVGKNLTGATPEALPAGQKLDVQIGSPSGAPANTGMNLDKLRAAYKLFLANNVDVTRETPVCAMTPEEHEDLSRFTELTSSDFYKDDNEKPYYIGGFLARAMGFNFELYNELPKTGNIRTCPAWVKSGVQMGEWEEVSPGMWPLPEKRMIPQLYAKRVIGVTRLQNEAVVEIPCDESV